MVTAACVSSPAVTARRRGPAGTFTELNPVGCEPCAWQGDAAIPTGHHAVIAVLEGGITLANGEALDDGDSAVFSASGGDLELSVREPTTLLVMSGVPIDEPIVGYGPFVMNSREEIIAAFEDVNAGRFGPARCLSAARLSPATGVANCFWYSWAYSPAAATSSPCVPRSTMRPSCSTRMRSAAQHGGKPVCDHEGGASGQRFFQRGLHRGLGVGIQMCGSFIQHHEIG